MIALLRKDLPWLLALLVAGTATLTIALAERGFVDVWVLPPTRLYPVFHAGWIAGAVLGLCAVGYDEVLGTRDFLRHRPLSRRRLHGARVLGCGLVWLGWFVLPAALHWLSEALLGQNVDLLQPGQLVEVWATLLPAATATAITLFAGTLPCGPLLRLAAAAASLLATFTLLDLLAQPATRPDLWTHSLPAFAGGHLAATALFLVASFAGAGRDADADRPWPDRSRRFGGSLAVLLFALLMAMVLGTVQSSLLRELLVARPVVVAVDGSLQLAIRGLERGQRVYWPVDREHHVAGPAITRERVREAGEGAVWLGTMEPGFDAPRFHSRRTSTYYGTTLLFGDGRAFVWHDHELTGRVSLTATGKGRLRERFGDDARVLDDLRDRDGWIVEPGAGALWRYDDALQHFVPVPLPGGDRLLSVRSVRPHDGGRRDRVEVEDLIYNIDTQSRFALVGARGVYWRSGDEVVTAPEWVQQDLQRPAAQSREVVDPDLLAPHLQLRDAGGAVLFEHVFAPRTAAERSFAALALAGSLLRPPLCAVAAHWLSAPGAQRDPTLDPLLAGGRRPWLLFGDVLIAVVAAALGNRRLRGLGADAGTRRLWVALVLLLGPSALLASLFVERRRAWAPAIADDVPPSRPRIESPIPEGA